MLADVPYAEAARIVLPIVPHAERLGMRANEVVKALEAVTGRRWRRRGAGRLVTLTEANLPDTPSVLCIRHPDDRHGHLIAWCDGRVYDPALPTPRKVATYAKRSEVEGCLVRWVAVEEGK
jgi:hypothetical protein